MYKGTAQNGSECKGLLQNKKAWPNKIDSGTSCVDKVDRNKEKH